MQSAPSIWRASAEQEKLASEYPLKKFIDFYSRRLLVLLFTFFLSGVMFGVISLAIRFPYVSIVMLAALLVAAFSWYLLPQRFNSKFVQRLLRVKKLAARIEGPAKTRIAVTHRVIEKVYVLRLSGNLIADTSDELMVQVRSALHLGHDRILLDLSDVGYVDSSGIGNLISCYTLVQREGGQLKLLGLSSRAMDLLNFDFETYFDVETALAAFGTSNKSGTTQH